MTETDYRHYYASIGRCPYCHGKEKLMGNEKMCPDCKVKRYAQESKRRSSYENRKNDNVLARKRREFRKQQGICTDCGAEAEEGYSTCQQCRIKRRISANKYYMKKRSYG